jgi:hypothetical protein
VSLPKGFNLRSSENYEISRRVKVPIAESEDEEPIGILNFVLS